MRIMSKIRFLRMLRSRKRFNSLFRLCVPLSAIAGTGQVEKQEQKQNAILFWEVLSYFFVFACSG